VLHRFAAGSQLGLGVAGGPQPELGGQHRQPVEPPGFPRLVVGGRLVELDEVTDAPGDRVAIVLEPVGAPRTANAEHAREIACDGRLLGDDELHAVSLRGASDGPPGPYFGR